MKKDFPDHYRSIERERRLDLLRCPSVLSRFRKPPHKKTILHQVRDKIFRSLWKNPSGLVVSLTPDDLQPDAAIDFFSGFLLDDPSEKSLRNLLICLRYNDLLSPEQIALLVITNFENEGDDDSATYRDLINHFHFSWNNARYFDPELRAALIRRLFSLLNPRQYGLIERIEMN